MKLQAMLLLALLAAPFTLRGQVCFAPEPAQTYQFGANRRDVKAADMNADGHTDLIVADYQGTSVTVLKNTGALNPNGTPQFTAINAQVGSKPFYLYVGDMEGDGDTDIAVTNQNSGTVTVLLNDGNINFSAAHYTLGQSPAGIIGGKFNNDSYIDLAVAIEGDKTVRVLFGSANGAFTLSPSIVDLAPYAPEDVAAGEFDDVPGLDLVVTLNQGTDAFYRFLRNEGSGIFTTPAPTAHLTGIKCTSTNSYSSSVDTADFNNDGRTDIAMLFPNLSDQNIVTLKAPSTGSGASWAEGAIPLNYIAYDFDIADFNGDGNADIATVFGTGSGGMMDSVKVLLGNGTGDGDGGFPARKNVRGLYDRRPRALVAVDFNHDGKPDLTSANLATAVGANEDIYMWLNTTPFFDLSGEFDVCGPAPQTVTVTAENNPGLSYSWVAGAQTGSDDTFTFIANALMNYFSVSGNDGIGCVNKSFGRVRIHPLPLVDISATLPQICKGDTVSLSVAGNAIDHTWEPAITPNQPFSPTATALYEVTGYNDLGCLAIDTLTIIVHDLPTVTTVLNGATIEAAATPVNVSYQWLNCNGNTDIAGATAMNYTPGQTGSYAVRVISPQGCKDVSDCLSVTVNNASMNDASIEPTLLLYPNPTTGGFFIKSTETIERVIITDLLGKTIHEANTTHQAGVTFANLNQPAGVYSVTIKTSAAVYYRKIVLR